MELKPKHITSKLLFVFFIASILSLKSDDWQLEKSKSGIKVYTRKIDNSTFKEFKAILVVKGNIKDVAAVINDISSYKDWMANVSETKTIKRTGDSSLIYYSVIDAPWPVDDRDGVYQIDFKHNRRRKAIKANLKADLKSYPEVEGMVRVKMVNGYWYIKDLEDGNVKVIYQMHAEPGGSIPAWLANSSVVDNPFSTLENLKDQMKLSKYKNKKLDFVK